MYSCDDPTWQQSALHGGDTWTLISAYIGNHMLSKCGMKFLVYPQTSTASVGWTILAMFKTLQWRHNECDSVSNH